MRRPRFLFDHAQIAVSDLERASSRLLAEHGLVSLPGGRHGGRGTANRIIPLGESYLELIAVVDDQEAERLPTSRRVAAAVAAGRTFSAWAVRTEELDEARTWLAGLGFALPELSPGSRTRPDGVRLEWRMQELVAGAQPSVLPFLIEWRLPQGRYPGEMEAVHPSGASAVAGLTVAAPDPRSAERLLRTVFGDDLEVGVEEGPVAGLVAVEVETPRGRMVLR